MRKINVLIVSVVLVLVLTLLCGSAWAKWEVFWEDTIPTTDVYRLFTGRNIPGPEDAKIALFVNGIPISVYSWDKKPVFIVVAIPVEEGDLVSWKYWVPDRVCTDPPT